MGNRSPSSEEILRSLEPAIDRVEHTLQAARSRGQSDAQIALGIRAVGLLRGFLDKLIKQIGDQDLAERVTVYRLVAERCAGFLEQPLEAVFPAVLSLLAESDINLTESMPAPAPEVVSSLRQILLRVTVTYAVKDGGDLGERTVVVLLHEVQSRQVREYKMAQEMPWENMPEDVREQFLRNNQRPVAFTLYPEEQQ